MSTGNEKTPAGRLQLQLGDVAEIDLPPKTWSR